MTVSQYTISVCCIFKISNLTNSFHKATLTPPPFLSMVILIYQSRYRCIHIKAINSIFVSSSPQTQARIARSVVFNPLLSIFLTSTKECSKILGNQCPVPRF